MISIPQPEQLLADWGVPFGLILVVVVGVWLIRTSETLAKPVRWLFGRIRPRDAELVPDTHQLERWEQHLQARMEELWVYGERAPLRAAEQDSRGALVYLSLESNADLLHARRQSATSIQTGQPVELADDLNPGEMFELLDGSTLIVGDPGSGKSVLLWQILRDLLPTSGNHYSQVPG